MTTARPPSPPHDDAAAADPDPAERRKQALARLAASRDQMLMCMLPPLPAPAASTGCRHPVRRLIALWRLAQARLKASALPDLLQSLAQNWWRRHPLHPVGSLVQQELEQAVVPLIRQNPRTAVIVSAGAAAAVVALRPWRWGWVEQELRGMPLRLRVRAARLLQQVPWDVVRDLVAAAVMRQQGAATATAVAAASTAAASSSSSADPR